MVPTHLYGIASDVRARPAVDRQARGVAIVEDAAQAMEEDSDDRKLGTLGDAGFFSLGRGKAFSTVEGGVILTTATTSRRLCGPPGGAPGVRGRGARLR